MKQKKIKIESSTLFVYRPKSGSTKSNDTTDPTVVTGTTTSAMVLV